MQVIEIKSTLQFGLALSATEEAEYVILTKIIKESIYLKGLIKELLGYLSNVCVFCDSQCAIDLSKN